MLANQHRHSKKKAQQLTRQTKEMKETRFASSGGKSLCPRRAFASEL